MMSVTIVGTTFTGANDDGTPCIDLASPTDLRMVDWHCIGPVYYGAPGWRARLAWWLLGLHVTIRPSTRSLGAPPPRSPMLRIVR